MAVYNFVICAAFLLLSACNAAPTEDNKTLSIKVPSACKGERFCPIKPEGYDELEDRINGVLPEFLIKEYSDRDGEETQLPTLSPEDDWHNCPTETSVKSMYLYNHGENETRTEIIVQTKLFRQYIKIVTCATQHINQTSSEQCFQDLNLGDFGMKSSCHTSSAKRTLYVYDIDKGKVIQKSFDVPACCTCKIAYVD